MAIGRNDPCPCGSGKKFKQCCGSFNAAALPRTAKPGTDTIELLRLAVTHQKAGRLQQAQQIYQDILRSEPHQPDALDLLGVLVFQLGRHEEGIALIRKAVTFDKHNSQHHLNLGKALKDSGKLDEAIASYRQALKLSPQDPHILNNLGVALQSQKKIEAAIECYQSALRLNPSFADARYNLANALGDQNKLDEAITVYRQVLQLSPNYVSAYRNMGNALLKLDRLEETAQCYAKVVQLNPENAKVHRDLGAVLSIQGKLDEAANCFRQAVKLDPNYIRAYLGVTLGHQDDATREDIDHLRSMLERQDLTLDDRISIGFALGKIYDDAGHYDAAYSHYLEANQLERVALAAKGKHFNPSEFSRKIDRIIHAYTKPVIEEKGRWGHKTELPVFIVGMPRSGTTLLEQIAASHSQVYGAGELHEMERLAQSLEKKQTRKTHQGSHGLQQTVASWDQGSIMDMASKHLDHIERLSGTARYVIDKLPDNILHLGLITILLPQAKIILCRRDPRDICLSCFFQRFEKGLPYTTDLGDCALRYLEIERLVAHWKNVLPHPMLEINYEDLIKNQEEESRRVISFLGLEWEPSCLEFHRTERYIKTASVWQVRQPLYNSSVGRWRHYEKHLQPMLDVLKSGFST